MNQIKPRGYWLFTSYSFSSMRLLFPSFNDDGMGNNHLIMAFFGGWFHTTVNEKGVISPIRMNYSCSHGNRPAECSRGSEKPLLIPQARCSHP